MKLTIGMACYDDFDGVYFTINSILQYHREVIDDIRFVVIDGNPDSSHGKACEQLIAKLTNKHGNCGLYVKNVSWASTASRDYVFQYAATPYVLCMDSHVLLAPGSLKKLIDYYDDNPGTKNLIQGPLYNENNELFATQMDPIWDYNMFGKWSKDTSLISTDQPWFPELMGLGMFSCTKAAWPGFNPAFKGFGGEEGYIHYKFKNNGGKTIMFPWLKWIHRFSRPNGVPYVNDYIDRIKNYLIGWHEVGISTRPVIDYYSKDNTNPGQERSAININQLETMDKQCKMLVDRQQNIDLNSSPEKQIIQNLEQKIKQLETTIEQL